MHTRLNVNGSIFYVQKAKTNSVKKINSIKVLVDVNFLCVKRPIKVESHMYTVRYLFERWIIVLYFDIQQIELDYYYLTIKCALKELKQQISDIKSHIFLCLSKQTDLMLSQNVQYYTHILKQLNLNCIIQGLKLQVHVLDIMLS